MQYALRALLLGLVGSCMVAAFGTMPDLSQFKDATIGVRGENTDDDDTIDLKLDENFCTNIVSKTYIGTQYCYQAGLDKESCGSGSDVYRRSDNPEKEDNYDVCQWKNGKCNMAGVTYKCGKKCFPTGQSITESEDSSCGTGEVLVKCGPAELGPPVEECVADDVTTQCKETNVAEIDDTYSPAKVTVQKKWELLKIVPLRRRKLQSNTCDCKGVLSSEQVSDSMARVVEDKCSCVSVGNPPTSQCSCNEVTSIVFTDTESTMDEETAKDSDDICTDVDPIYW